MINVNGVVLVMLVLDSGFVRSLTAGAVEEKIDSKAENKAKVLMDQNGRDRRDIRRSGLKIGMFSPLMCEHLRRHMIRIGRNIKRAERGTRRTQLGFFTEIYCKGLSSWLKQTKDHYHGYEFRDCQDVQKYYGKRYARSGVYTIHPKGGRTIKVYCDMKTAGGGWTVFQHRYDGSVNFYRPWADYKNGFGNLHKEFWLGNNNIHRITEGGKYKLRIEMEDFSGNKRYAEYSSFSVADEKNKYRLNIGSYSGTAGDALSYHNNMMFSTKDRDHDRTRYSCSTSHASAWWFKSCVRANLNGVYKNSKASAWNYIVWHHWPGGRTNMKTTTMMENEFEALINTFINCTQQKERWSLFFQYD